MTLHPEKGGRTLDKFAMPPDSLPMPPKGFKKRDVYPVVFGEKTSGLTITQLRDAALSEGLELTFDASFKVLNFFNKAGKKVGVTTQFVNDHDIDFVLDTVLSKMNMLPIRFGYQKMRDAPFQEQRKRDQQTESYREELRQMAGLGGLLGGALSGALGGQMAAQQGNYMNCNLANQTWTNGQTFETSTTGYMTWPEVQKRNPDVDTVYLDLARQASIAVPPTEERMQVKLTLKEAQYLETLTDKEPMLKDILAKIEEGADFQIVVSFRSDDD